MSRHARPLLLLTCLSLAGCADYVGRSDLISPHAGEALMANRAIQTINPWPRDGFNQSLRGDGPRTEAAIQRYRNPETTSAPATPARPAAAVINIQN